MKRRCACRGVIEADPTDSAEVAAAVVRHQQRPQHRDWWDRTVIEDEKVSLPVRVVTATLRRVA